MYKIWICQLSENNVDPKKSLYHHPLSSYTADYIPTIYPLYLSRFLCLMTNPKLLQTHYIPIVTHG